MKPSFSSPRSLQGIKRRAKTIAKSDGIPYLQALDITSRSAGFTNWKHALRYCPDTLCLARISASWDFPRKNGIQTIGVESISYPMKKSIQEMVAHEYAHNLFGWAVITAEGTAELQGSNFDQFEARLKVCRYLRSLMFQDATGFVPSFGSRFWPTQTDGNLSWDVSLPCIGSYRFWIDPFTKNKVITIEQDGISELAYRNDQLSWCEQHGFEMLALQWRGILDPDQGLQLSLLTKKGSGVNLRALASAINQLPDDFGPTNWPGTSSTRHETISSRHTQQGVAFNE